MDSRFADSPCSIWHRTRATGYVRHFNEGIIAIYDAARVSGLVEIVDSIGDLPLRA